VDFGQITGPLAVVRAILGFILVFLVPGFAWTLVFFKKVNIVERIALGIGLSIALVTLATIVLNIIFHVKINGFNALVTIIVLTLIPVGIYLIQRYRRRKSKASDGE
jgi:uncharacterized membrane protein